MFPRTSETGLEHQDDGVEESLFGLITPFIRENVGEPIRDEDGAEPEREGRGQNEAITPGEWHSRDDADTGDGDGAEEKSREAAEDRVGDGDEGGGELGEDAHDGEEETGGVAGLAVRAAGQGDDTVVLGEGGHGGDGAEAGEEAVEAVGQYTTLDARVEEFTLDFQPRHIACGRDVADGFHHEDNVHGQEGQDDGRIDFQGERLNPDEGGSGSGVDAGGRKVARCAGDDAADEETDDHGTGFHNRAAEALAEYDGREDGEAESDVLGTAPWECVGRADLGADDVGTARRMSDATRGARSSGPVLESALNQSDPDEHDGGPGDEWGEDALQDRWFGE